MRTALQPGSRLLLGGVEYTIEAVEGSGSSAVVYRAAYEDALNRGALHRVLIKELFPLSAQGGIERAPDGGVVCTGPGLAVMEEAKRRFLMGNQVNLELLAGRPGTSTPLMRGAPTTPCSPCTEARACCARWTRAGASL